MANLKKQTGKKHIPVKTSFTTPFSIQWSTLPQEDMHFILKTLQEKFISAGLEKKEVKEFRQWRKKKGQIPSVTSEPVPEEVQVKDPPKNGWTNVSARRQLAIGINEVTKALERNELELVLVCKSVKPKHMTNHLITLSATRGVPACQVPRLSQSVSEQLGLKSVLALGFRRCASKDDSVFNEAVDAITPRVPPLDIEWLQAAAATAVHTDSPETEEERAEKTGSKRKRETESEDAAESVPCCALQPLKVKRIVANPAKKRKTKHASKAVK